ncbi:MAG: AAA family ATPase [Acutalibacteraceae bacterium]|nr:AAA family ATPase [Acutalibacteraceae bacterium]
MKLPKLDYDEPIDIDPFTVFGLFNKGITTSNRIKISTAFKSEFGVASNVPSEFLGVPVVNNLSATFYYFVGDREEHDIDNLWELFEMALQYSVSNTKESKEKVISAYDKVIKQKGAAWNITMGLYWIRPYSYINLDSYSRKAFNALKMIPPIDYNIIPLIKTLPSGNDYFNIIDICKEVFANHNLDFPTLSYNAWEYNKQNGRETEEYTDTGWWPSLEYFNPNISKENWKKYILDVEKPNHSTSMQMLKAMLELGGEASCKKLSDTYGGTPSRYVGGAVNLGKRVKEYFNLPSCIDDNQERYFPFPFFGKPDNQNYMYKIRPELLQALEEIDLSDISSFYIEEIADNIEPYTKTDFLKDVYITEEKYDTCVSRLKYKKNLILQGAPGVGKTYAARRLAWSIMGTKDDTRIKFVQFHQSYSYEDFIMGYKPIENGFELQKGVFYNFCIQAKKDPDNKYFFIIDEINRGNMSKIFGELLMLIENDYRGEEITLAYDNNTPFCVPKNLYIIGMMNTADRSLAMIDYALRRRFSFVEMTPGFDSEGFKGYQSDINNTTFDRLIGRIKALNTDIESDQSLGKGFCIGHSYFCNLEANCETSILKEIVEYDIIPMLEEYWFDDETKSNNWSNDLRGIFNE